MNIPIINCSIGSGLLIFFADFSVWREGKSVGRINEKSERSCLGLLERRKNNDGEKALFSKSKYVWFLFSCL